MDCLESIPLYKKRHLRVTFAAVVFSDAHYDCILNLKNILRRFNIISELNVTYADTDTHDLRLQPSRIIPVILSITNAKEVNLSSMSDMSWYRSRFEQRIRLIKLEENALYSRYSRLLPIFDSVISKRREDNLKLLEDQPQETDAKRLSNNSV